MTNPALLRDMAAQLTAWAASSHPQWSGRELVLRAAQGASDAADALEDLDAKVVALRAARPKWRTP